jgi:hypothetical protein
MGLASCRSKTVDGAGGAADDDEVPVQMQGYFTTHNVRFNPPRDQYYVSQTE